MMINVFAAFTSPTVTRKPELCRPGYSEWINRDSPDSGDGDREVRHYKLHFHKYSLKAGWDEVIEVRWLLSWFDRVKKFMSQAAMKHIWKINSKCRYS